MMQGFPGALGIYGESADDGCSSLRFCAQAVHLNQAGTVHGGVLASLADAAMGLAARSTTEAGETPATSQLTIAYLRAGRPGVMEVSGRVIRRGETVLLCEADIEQAGRSLVHAVATFALI
jgi:uncharacterized protein (TIGR00369 family)